MKSSSHLSYVEGYGLRDIAIHILWLILVGHSEGKSACKNRYHFEELQENIRTFSLFPYSSFDIQGVNKIIETQRN
jgi:hypothetical protein